MIGDNVRRKRMMMVIIAAVTIAVTSVAVTVVAVSVVVLLQDRWLDEVVLTDEVEPL